jgi:hypothetical protein
LAPGFRICEGGKIQDERAELEFRVEFADHLAEFVLNRTRSIIGAGAWTTDGVCCNKHKFALTQDECRVTGVSLGQ